MLSRSCVFAVAVFGLIHGGGAAQTVGEGDVGREPAPWRSDYGEAMREARLAGKMLLVFFYDPKAAEMQQQFDERLFGNASNREAVRQYVLAKVPVDMRVSVKGEQVLLLGHAAFGEMQRRPGIAIIDLTDPTNGQFQRVVSVYPFGGAVISTSELSVLLSLPQGTLTQRTLIFAVRTHPEHPASTTGEMFAVLAKESEQQSNYQAQIGVQGHHNWDSRFQRINARLPGGLMAQEVCAESWPGQGLLEAARECVHSWRQSPGHWSAVRAGHPLFGYDMKRGANGVWYATGIFARRD